MIPSSYSPSRTQPHRSSRRRLRRASGSVLVEFALVSLAFYLLIAAIVTFGGILNTAQVAQDAARAGARELSLIPLPANFTFDQAMANSVVRARVFDPDQLVIDLDNIPGGDLDAHFASMPVVNRALRPAMILDLNEYGGTLRRLMRFPGALLISPNPANPTGLTVGVPRIVSRDANGHETVEWIPVVEEVRSDRSDPTTGVFSASSTSADQGLVSLRINIPYQSAAMSSFRADAVDPMAPNGNNFNEADDSKVTQLNAPPYGSTLSSGTHTLTYQGRFGMGRQEALGKRIRPFRRLLVAQAIYRREVYAEQSR